MIPRPPIAISGNVIASSPESTRKSAGTALQTSHICVMFPDASFTPTILGIVASLARVPRPAPAADVDSLMRLSRGTRWKLPADEAVHALGTDPCSTVFLSGGVIYPCQAIFLAPTIRVWPRAEWMDANRLAMVEPSTTTSYLV